MKRSKRAATRHSQKGGMRQVRYAGADPQPECRLRDACSVGFATVGFGGVAEAAPHGPRMLRDR